MLRRVNVAVFVVVGSVAMYMCMGEFMTVLIYMCVLVKMFMCMCVTVLVIIRHFSLPVLCFSDNKHCNKRAGES